MERKKVFILDDEHDITDMLSSWVKKCGHSVLTSSSIKEAKQKLQDFLPDMAILDIKLPDGEGFTLIPTLTQNPNVSIAMMSAFDGHDERNKAKSNGIEFFFSKPFTKDSILKFVNSSNTYEQ